MFLVCDAQIFRAIARRKGDPRVLTHRRRWYSDDLQADQQTESSNEIGVLQAQLNELQERLKQVNAESAERRVRLKAVEQERLVEQGRYKELAEGAQREADELRPYRERAEALDKIIRSGNERMIETIPSDMRGLIPMGYSPEQLSDWLSANVGLLRKPAAPPMDAGARGTSGDGATLTPDEIAMANRMGVSHDVYAKYKDKLKR